ncbi:hypothetical protein TNCV_4999241 [Trichonephila clavipes]|nr:hypothetical protein TNCV_4999241 [Trichonephila clavipes]
MIKKQQFRPANILYSISSSVNKLIYLKKGKDVQLASKKRTESSGHHVFALAVLPNEKWKDECYAVCSGSVDAQSLAIYDGDSVVWKFLNPGNRQVAAWDQICIVQRYQPVRYQVYPRVQVLRKKLYQNRSFLIFEEKEVFLSQWVSTVGILEHKNDGGWKLICVEMRQEWQIIQH